MSAADDHNTKIELNTWQEIADYFGVSDRTVQTWHKKRGLPVTKMGGRVVASTQELEAWKRQGQMKPALMAERSEDQDSVGEAPPEPSCNNEQPNQAEETVTKKTSGELIETVAPGTPSDRRAPLRSKLRAIRYMVPAGFLLVLGTWLYWTLVPHGPPIDVQVHGSNLIVVNAKGQELWWHNFTTPLDLGFYTPWKKSQQTWIGDLDGDGKSEVVFVVSPVGRENTGSWVACFSSDHRIKWEFKPGRPVTDGSGDNMLPPYFVSGIQVMIGKTGADTRIVVSSNHYLNQPNPVTILNANGQVIGEYWHPGQLLRMGQVDLDGDGKNEILLVGVNNGNHQATLVVLDPWKISSLMTPVNLQDRRFELLGMRAAREKAVVLFPRSCISLGQPYTRARKLHITTNRLVVEVVEGADADKDPGFAYELDYGLRVVSVVPMGVGVINAHHKLEAQGLLDHPFSDEECERLKAGVVVRRE